MRPPRVLRTVGRLVRVAAHCAHGLAIVLWRFPVLGPAARHERVQWWSAALLHRLGVRSVVTGAFVPGAKLVVSNHVSWLDVVALHAICPHARFVAKAEVQRWPLVGRLVAAGATLYLERERTRDALRAVRQVAGALRDGDTVAVFPEGTTGDGRTLLAFHSNLLQAAVVAAVPVQPVALRFSDAEHAVSPAALWLGGTTLARTVWRLAAAEGLVVAISVLPALPAGQGDRRALTRAARQRIESALAA